jgi:glycosyltransferase involved in cell wall biosynthesis
MLPGSWLDYRGGAGRREVDSQVHGQDIGPPGAMGAGRRQMAMSSMATQAQPQSTAQIIPGRPRTGPKQPVTIVIPTKNEEENILRCLQQVDWADEILVVDSSSADRTQQIALEFGATVVNFHWNGQWPKKRNWVLENIPFRHEWVLIVDADELITPELAAEVAEAVRSGDHVGYYVNRRFMFLNRWIRHAGYYPSWNLRLIKRGHGRYEKLTDIGDTGSGDNEVHEHVVADGPVGYLRHDMLHYAFPNISTWVEKHNRYSSWEAAVQFRGAGTGAEVSGNAQLSTKRWLKNLSRKLPFRPALRFFYHYVVCRGFLDGRAGFLFCRLLAMYEFLSVAKHYELTLAARDKAREQDPA